MRFEHCRIVHLVNMVAGKDKHVFGIIHFHEMHILINCICRAFIPRRTGLCLIRRKNMYAAVRSVEIPRLSVSNVFVEDKRLILRQNADGIDARVDAVRQREIDDTIFCPERHRRFRNVRG